MRKSQEVGRSGFRASERGSKRFVLMCDARQKARAESRQTRACRFSAAGGNTGKPAGRRIRAENIIRRSKRFRILAERYRNRRKRFGLRFNLRQRQRCELQDRRNQSRRSSVRVCQIYLSICLRTTPDKVRIKADVTIHPRIA